jgi:hypothetical protein
MKDRRRTLPEWDIKLIDSDLLYNPPALLKAYIASAGVHLQCSPTQVLNHVIVSRGVGDCPEMRNHTVLTLVCQHTLGTCVIQQPCLGSPRGNKLEAAPRHPR